MVCKSRSPPRLNRKFVVPSFLVNSSEAVLVKMFPVLFRLIRRRPMVGIIVSVFTAFCIFVLDYWVFYFFDCAREW